MQLVRIKESPETKRLGLAGKIGEVWGWTTPSSSRVSVVGEVAEDYAVSIHFEDISEAFWLSPELLERLDHHPGLEATIGGKRIFYTPDARWQEVTEPQIRASAPRGIASER